MSTALLSASTRVGGTTGGLTAVDASALPVGPAVGRALVLSGTASRVSALGARNVLSRSRLRPRPRPLRGPRGRALPERETSRPLFAVSDAFTGGFIGDIKLFALLEVDSERLVVGTAKAGKLGGRSMILKRGGGFSTVGFNPEEAEAFGLSTEGEAPGFDLELSSDCEDVVPAVDNELGRIGGNPRLDGCTGRCLMCSEIAWDCADAAPWGSACEVTSVHR